MLPGSESDDFSASANRLRRARSRPFAVPLPFARVVDLLLSLFQRPHDLLHPTRARVIIVVFRTAVLRPVTKRRQICHECSSSIGQQSSVMPRWSRQRVVVGKPWENEPLIHEQLSSMAAIAMLRSSVPSSRTRFCNLLSGKLSRTDGHVS
jgi:hypothetical protein